MMQQHYTFGGNTGRSYEDLQRQRHLAQSLAGPPVMPRTLGQGLSALGHALAQRVIAGRMAHSQAERQEQNNAQLSDAFSGVVDPRLMRVMNSPDMANGPKALAMLLAQRALRNSEPPDPMKQLQLQEKRLRLGQMQAQLEQMQHPQRRIITGADGYKYYADGNKERVFPNAQRPEEPGYQVLTPEQTQQFGLPEGAYQQDPHGRISQIGGSGTDVTINTQAETQLQKKRGEGLANRLNGIAEDGIKALDDLTTINRLGGLLGGVDTSGAWPAVANAISSSTGQSWLSTDTPKYQAIQALVDYMTPRMRVAGSGQSSDKDVEIFRNALPSLMKTQEGNRLIVETLGGMAQRRADLGDIAVQWQLGEISAAEAYKQMRELPDPFRVFSERFNNANGSLPYEEYFRGYPGD